MPGYCQPGAIVDFSSSVVAAEQVLGWVIETDRGTGRTTTVTQKMATIDGPHFDLVPAD